MEIQKFWIAGVFGHKSTKARDPRILKVREGYRQHNCTGVREFGIKAAHVCGSECVQEPEVVGERWRVSAVAPKSQEFRGTKARFCGSLDA